MLGRVNSRCDGSHFGALLVDQLHHTGAWSRPLGRRTLLGVRDSIYSCYDLCIFFFPVAKRLPFSKDPRVDFLLRKHRGNVEQLSFCPGGGRL